MPGVARLGPQYSRIYRREGNRVLELSTPGYIEERGTEYWN
jgi:hypothetical protein